MKTRPQPKNRSPLSNFARDLAARLERVMPSRPTRVAPPAGARGRPVLPPVVGGSVSSVAERLLGMNLAHPMEAIEVALLSRAMISANGNITAASRILGIHRKAVERLVTKHKVKRTGKPRPQRPPAAKRGRARQLKKRR